MTNGHRPSGQQAPSGLEIQTANNTLHTLLGNLGGRQKAWMVPPGSLPQATNIPAQPPQPPQPPKRKRGRPRLPSRQESDRPQFAESSSSAPVSGHGVNGRVNTEPLQTQPSRPAPSPVERSNPGIPSGQPWIQPFATSAGSPSNANTHILPPNGSPHTLRQSLPEGTSGTTRPGASTGPVHRQVQAAVRSPQEHTSSRSFSRPSLTNTQQQSHRPPTHHTQVPRDSFPASQTVVASPLLPSGTLDQPPMELALQSAQQRAPNQDHPRTEAQLQSNLIANAIGSPQMAQEAPTYNRPTREYLLAVHEFVDLHPPTPQYPRDRPRLQVLCNALEVNDWDYLIIHQIYCLLEDAPDQLPPQILQHPGVGNAQDLLNHVLDSNALLSPELRLFFINMPHPMSVYTSLWPLVLQQHCDVFIQFAAQATNINNLHSMCRQRNFPPFAGELFHDVGIGSFTLQKLLFTAAFRHIMKLGHTPRAQHLEERALDIFRQNYMAFADSVKARPGDPYEPAARAQEHGCWSAQFLQMCKHRAVPNPPLSQQQQGHVGSQRNQPVQPPTVLVPNYNALYNSRPQAPIENAQHFGAQFINAAPPSQQGPHATDRPRLRMSVSHDSGRAVDMRKPGSPLLPAAPFRLPQQRQPVPARFALHQAHLRSPTLKARQEETILYQYVDAFAVKPTRLVALGGRIAEWKLSISDEQMRSIPTNLFNNIAGAPSTRVISQDSQLFRLRCITWNKSQPPSEHEWATAPTSWCPSAYFTFNNQPLEMRKKIHYGKSLPVDLTPMIKPGENVLKIGIVRPSGDESYQTYLLAIEIVTTARHDTIINKCVEENCLSAPQVREAIIQRLSGNSLDDEEIAIIQNNLTIGLLDPFSASKMCDIPARSRACLHNECFDLETFLKTRDRHGDCSVTDKWRCPICTADARPQHLVVDAFLQSVYAELDREGLKGVREIIVNQDGEWAPKAVPREDSVQDHSTAAEDRNSSVGPARTEASRLPSADIDIIDIIDISD